MPWRSNLRIAFGAEPSAPPDVAADETPESGKPRAPRCPNCNIDTLWYQSRLQRQNGKSKIVHSFHCPNCAMVVQTEEPNRQALRVV
jgi:hypothetical protein